jgi:endonuclease/exonuclease/phosphatase family metal-dependent hydrolase
MVRLASADRPALLLLQEVPAWALARLAGWSGMVTIGDLARPAALGPVPLTAGVGRRVTSLHAGVLRSALSGQGNAVLLGPGLRQVGHEALVLNPRELRDEQARLLGLDPRMRRAWARERRIAQILRVEHDGGRPLLVGHLHATSSPRDPRLPEAEVERAAARLEALARPGDVVLLGGDFNVRPGSRVLGWGGTPGPGIDHLLVRGAGASPLRVWPDERRRLHGILLSDHAPVELDIIPP